MSSKVLFKGLRGVIFDVDGTLYSQRCIRRKMSLELIKFGLRNPQQLLTLLRVIYVFRKERERLRYHQPGVGVSLEEAQYLLPAQRLGVSPALVRGIVQEWIYLRPLRHLRKCKLPGVDKFLFFCRKRRLVTGVFSDYPAEQKLKALGLFPFIDAVVWTTDKRINAFKPSPKGLEVVLKELNLAPHQALYVGDRLDVDAKCAKQAGVPFVLLSSKAKADHTLRVKDFFELASLVFDDGFF